MVKGSSGIQKIDFVKKKNKNLRDPDVEREKKNIFLNSIIIDPVLCIRVKPPYTYVINYSIEN